MLRALIYRGHRHQTTARAFVRHDAAFGIGARLNVGACGDAIQRAGGRDAAGDRPAAGKGRIGTVSRTTCNRGRCLLYIAAADRAPLDKLCKQLMAAGGACVVFAQQSRVTRKAAIRCMMLAPAADLPPRPDIHG